MGAHAHGVLWCNMKKLENQPSENDEDEKPFKNISKTFKKLRNSEKLEKEDRDRLIRFIDRFITVSTLNKKVGTDVVGIVNDVNKHHHTKTCRKNGTVCRFKFPRPPTPKTIIAVPITEIETKLTQDKCNEIIGKVLDAADGTAEQIKTIFDKLDHDKEKERLSKHQDNKIKRIKEVCKQADVQYDKYIEALGISFN